MDASNGQDLLLVKNLRKYYAIKSGFLRRVSGHVKAVDGVSFSIRQGETLALVGESGCGKTTVARTVLRATDPTDGEILFGDQSGYVDVARLKGTALKQVRPNIQMIFQDPDSSLNPRHHIRRIIGEPLLVNGLARGKELDDRVAELMRAVGLRPEYAVRYPHAFSGGQRQRIGVARALAMDPKLIVCDEPVSALDMSIQAQIVNLLTDLQQDRGLSYLFISHDLGVVRQVSDRIAVMYLGKLVETAPSGQLLRHPTHPYTEALLAASPKPHPRHRGSMRVIAGELPDPAQEITGCDFRTRCPYAQPVCAEKDPPLRKVGSGDAEQLSACHFADELNLAGV